jgi:hypothetical protein
VFPFSTTRFYKAKRIQRTLPAKFTCQGVILIIFKGQKRYQKYLHRRCSLGIATDLHNGAALPEKGKSFSTPLWLALDRYGTRKLLPHRDSTYSGCTVAAPRSCGVISTAGWRGTRGWNAQNKLSATGMWGAILKELLRSLTWIVNATLKGSGPSVSRLIGKSCLVVSWSRGPVDRGCPSQLLPYRDGRTAAAAGCD